MAKSKFHFPLSVLIGASRRLHDALTDTVFATVMADRLNTDTDTPTGNFATRFSAELDALGAGDVSQKSKTGQTGSLTRSQDTDIAELERLMAGARRSARLAFPSDHVKLHSEFQVGINEPQTLDAELERANLILAGCQQAENVPALKVQGWLPKDTTALAAAIAQLSGSSLAKDGALGERIGLTGEKIVAANAVYADALRIQNAARLEYPANKPGTEAARARFLLDEFPPRDRSEPSGGTQAPPPSTTPTPSSGTTPV